MPCPFLNDCYNKGYRKCWNLCYYDKITELETYDDYGKGVDGILAFLRQHYGVKTVRYKSANALLVGDEFYYYHDSLSLMAETIITFNKINTRFKRELAFILDNVARRWPAGIKLLAKARLGDYEVYQLATLLAEYRDTPPLELEQRAKSLLASGYNFAGKLLTLLMAVKVADILEKDKFLKLLDESAGMALTVAHEAALLQRYNKRWRPGDAEELEKIASELPPENTWRRLALFVAKYLRWARALGEYMSSGDYSSISAYIAGDKAAVRLGAHHADVTLAPEGYRIHYADHNSSRFMAVMDFFGRVGFSVDKDNGVVTVPAERAEDAAKILAATTSIDIQGLIWIFRKAGGIEELLELRRQAGSSDDDDDYDDGW